MFQIYGGLSTKQEGNYSSCSFIISILFKKTKIFISV
jgi:hypothetical protein